MFSITWYSHTVEYYKKYVFCKFFLMSDIIGRRVSQGFIIIKL